MKHIRELSERNILENWANETYYRIEQMKRSKELSEWNVLENYWVNETH